MKVCLTGPTVGREILTLEDTSTTEDLYSICRQKFGPNIQLKTGFPPQPLDPNPTRSVSDAGIRNQERIQVVVLQSTNKTSNDESPTKRPRRQAAQAAMESFAQIEAATAAQAAAATTRTNPRRPQRRKPPPRNHHPSARRTSAQVNRHFARLESAARRTRPPPPPTNTSLEEGLVASTRLMRSNWKSAVNDAYELNQAVARTACSNVTFQRPDATTLVVHYPRGIQGRGHYTDTVDYLDRNVLQAAIEQIHPTNREALRPGNLALLSPRVFWSLRYHTRVETAAALAVLAPDLDWSFLRRRREQLSEKARENLRQAQQQHSNDHWEAAAAALQSVETAMATLQTRSTAVPNHHHRTTTWTIETPNEWDEEELRACVAANDGTTTTMNNDDNVTAIVEVLKNNNIRNWRELANVKDTAELCAAINAQLPNNIPSIDAWVEHAQSETLQEIMVEICEGDTELVERLRDEANSGTPKDLAVWRSIPEALRTTLGDQDEVETLRACAERAAAAVHQLDWLNDFVTPIGE